MKYKIVPIHEFFVEVEANSPEEAMETFAFEMDTDMNLYFKVEGGDEDDEV